MAIVKMKHVRIIAENRQKTDILSELMWLSSIDVSPLSRERLDENLRDDVQSDSDGAEGRKLEENASFLQQAIEALAPYYTGKKSIFTKRVSLSRKDFDDFEYKSRFIYADAKDVLEIKKEIARLKNEANKTRNLVYALAPWKSVPADFDKPLSKHTDIYIGTIPVDVSDRASIEALGDENGFELRVLQQDAQMLYVSAVFLKKDADRVGKVLDDIHFSRVTFKDLIGTAEYNLIIAEERLGQITDKEGALIIKLTEYAGKLSDFETAYDIVSNNSKIYTVRNRLMKTDTVFLLDGWCPVFRTAEVEKLADKYGFYCEFCDPEPDEEPPILLKNNRFASAFEGITEMYALPVYRGIDPDFMMSPFFFLFFGMMLGDLGYGAIVTIACFIAVKFGNFRPHMKNMLRMFLYCGISTMVWGILFGSCFGDVIPVFSETFFGSRAEFSPLWFSPLDEPLTLFVLSFAVGFLHIMVGLGMKAFMLIRDGHIGAAICDVGFWMILLLGVPVFALPSLITALPAVMGTVGLVMIIVGAAGLILTQGRDKKNPIMKLLGGIYSLYDVTGYLSDILSYSRILALGLSTSVIGSVFNKLATMFGGGPIGFVIFVVIFLVGTVLNIALSLLSSYVHSSRLQFIEFFGKFYEGGGVAYEPVGVEMKYTDLSCETSEKAVK